MRKREKMPLGSETSNGGDDIAPKSGRARLFVFFALCKFLLGAFTSKKIGKRADLRDMLRKFLVLAVASRLESELQKCLASILVARSGGHGRVLLNLVRQRPGEIFSLDASKAKGFYKRFGKDFAEFMESEEKEQPELAKGRSDFALIFNTRHHLIHKDLASNTTDVPEWGINDVKKNYRNASKFISKFGECMLEFANKQADGNPPPAP